MTSDTPPDDAQPAQPIHITSSGDNARIAIRDFNETHHHEAAKPTMECPAMPEKPAQFGGRDAELAALKAAVQRQQRVAMTAVHGMGGLGKTTLAKMLAHEVKEQNVFEVVVWTEVGPNASLFALLDAWARKGSSQYRLDPQQSVNEHIQAAKSLLTKAIREECGCATPARVLVMLDDVWDLALVKDLCRAVPDQTRILITTRSGKIADDLDRAPLRLGFLDDTAVVPFLREYIDGADAALQALGRVLGGHPLALKLAAARVRTALRKAGAKANIALKSVTEALQQDARLHDGSHKDESLTVSLDLSYAALTPADQGRFLALGVLADAPFNTALLAALWDMPPETVEDDGVMPLLDAALLEATETEGVYRIHALVRDYARRKLAARAEAQEAVFARYADHIIEIAEQFDTLSPEDWNAAFELSYPHILYVGDELEKIYHTQPQYTLYAQAFAYNIRRYLANRREVQRIVWLEMGLATARMLQEYNIPDEKFHWQQLENLFLNEIGAAWSSLGEKRQALAFYEQVLTFDRAVGNRNEQATTLNNMGSAWDTLGEPQKALALYEQSLALYLDLGDKRGEATTLGNIGMAWETLGESRKALEMYEQALPLMRTVGNSKGEATTLNNMGIAWSTLGNQHQALEMYEQALQLYQAVGDRGGEAATLNNMGLAWQELGNPRQALEMCKQALPLMQAVGDRSGQGYTLHSMSLIFEESGDIGQAIVCETQCVALLQVIEDVNAVASQQNLERLIQKRDGGPSAPPASTLPAEAVQMFANNTFAVKTGVPDKLAEWTTALTEQRADWAGRGDDWANEVGFADALLALLADQPFTIPPDNPYAEVVQQVSTAIANFKS